MGSIPAGGVRARGRLAQLVEQPLYTGKVGGPSPSASIMKKAQNIIFILCGLALVGVVIGLASPVKDKAGTKQVNGSQENMGAESGSWTPPHVMRAGGQSLVDVATVLLPIEVSPASSVPLIKSAQAQSASTTRALSYIDRDPDTNLNQVFLYDLNSGQHTQVTKEQVNIKSAYLIDYPVSVLIYITGEPARAYHIVSLSDGSKRSFPIKYEDEEMFALSPSRTKLAYFRGLTEKFFHQELKRESENIIFRISVRDLLSPGLEIVKEHKNPVSYYPEPGGPVTRGITSYIAWRDDESALY